MKNKKKYWKGTEELTNDPEFLKYADREFPEYLPINQNSTGEGSSRRDFLKMMGFSIAAASLAACETPVKKAIPYLNKPEEIDPSLPNYYASTYLDGGDFCSIVVKTREGRPIKLEGNTLCKITKGGTSAQVEAAVLSLYDKERLTKPIAMGKQAEWEAVDKEIISRLSEISGQGGQIRIVSNTILSPATKQVIEDFKAKFPSTRHITYDQQSAYGIRKANEQSFGKAVIPAYDFSKADVIVSFSADFLGTWISPIAYTKQYSLTRKLGKNKKKMSKHFQFEANLSLTGANADYRTPVRPSKEGLIIASLYNLLAQKAGMPRVNTPKMDTVAHLEDAAKALWAHKGRSLVVSSSNDADIQILINAINHLLGNYGKTIDLRKPVYYRQGDEKAMRTFVRDLKAGNIDAVIFYNANPVYDHMAGEEIAKGLEKVSLKIATSERMDETASLTDYVVPDHHFLESWNDAEPQLGYYSLMQPAISPLFQTRQVQESLLHWSGSQHKTYYDYLKAYWKKQHYDGRLTTDSFQAFWDNCLYNGIYESPAGEEAVLPVDFNTDLTRISQNIAKNYKTNTEETELVLYQKVGIGTGKQANNPWLHEMPDPVTKACWDNYLTISQSMANRLGIRYKEGYANMLELTVNGKTIKIPSLVQPGQAKGTVGLAIGYGRSKAGKVADNLGKSAYPFIGSINGTQSFNITGVQLKALSEKYKIAQTQTHQTYMGRENVIQESVLSAYREKPTAGRHSPKIAAYDGPKKPDMVSLWKGHLDSYNQHHWGLVIDLNACTGCAACTISCQAENNVPTVGREEVINRREMHWIRIDRYYSADVPAGKEDTELNFKELEVPAENPEVTFQPVMCQHCNNAPCETVCPVAATTHSTEGLNQMTYNRCVGTRYCANNCPYKVRRFNWFKYHDNKVFADVNVSMNDDLGKMVLNPDVTVRARGVMEKCSMCIQRIQAGKLQAKKEKRKLQDKDVNTACASACPSDALTFGDMKDPNSKIHKLLNDEIEERAYHMLEEIGVSPNVYYLTKIRNKDEA